MVLNFILPLTRDIIRTHNKSMMILNFIDFNDKIMNDIVQFKGKNMKNKKITAIIMILLTSFFFTGCGTKLVKLKKGEEEAAISYASSVVAKYNKNQDKGYIKKAYKKSSSKKGEKKKDSNKKDDNSQNGTAKDNDSPSLSDVLSVKGVTFTGKSFEVMDEYKNSDKSFVAPLKPKEGKSYLVYKVSAKNTTGADINVDLLSQNYIYFLKVNGSNPVQNEITILLNDLSTYKGTVKAGEEQELVLLFQFDKGKLKDIKEKSLEIKKNDKTVKINL